MIGEIKALVYDLEIVNCIPDRKEPPDPNLTYCKGWGDHAGMGISVLCAYDIFEDRYRVFCDDNKNEFFEACNDRLLITFNGRNFDNKVIQACWPEQPQWTFGGSYDLLAEIRSAGGGGSLNAICEVNGLSEKTGSGALAPTLWQQGHYGEVIDYCLNDVKMTIELFAMVYRGEGIVNPKNESQVLNLRNPF